MIYGAAPVVDNLFLLAVAALGWGLSLATYRLFAHSRGWPMGALQTETPFIPVLIGLTGLFAGLIFATARGAEDGGWVIIVLGLVFAGLWTGFLRVASQLSLILAPIATFLLLIGWFGFAQGQWVRERPAETLQRRGILRSDTPTVIPSRPAAGSTP
jgi:hypothetical protein